ncbi:MAG TPA: type IV toxin-antitoxin system AbiEi family antitoxin domain-containing protein [Thermoleophilaceae bacterium]|nr:type IV toxin-antitoxin system AbiEi family antitoxin domain-containing protein [Thermoleophilaceae bacterium]
MATKSPQQDAWELARRQHGVITRGQLLALGFSGAAIKHRLARGRLRRIYPGVHAVGQLELTQEGEWIAAVLACGETAALSHDSAAALWQLKAPPGAIHVSVLIDSRSRGGIIVHRRRALKTTTHKGIRVTTPAQTLIDVAGEWPASRLEQAIGEADLRRLVGLRALRTAATKAGKSGAPLRAVIDRATFRVTQSELEREFLRLVRRAAVPTPETQYRLDGMRVDFYWPEIGLVLEADGGSFHRTAAQQTKDRQRDQTHIRAGRTPLRVTHAQVFKDAAETTALLVAVVRRLGRRSPEA